MACLLLPLSGCMPSSFTVSLDADRRELYEQQVIGGDTTAGAKVAMIDLTGIIADRGRPTLFGAGANPVDEFLTRLHKAEHDSSVKAILVRINSPGGTVTASDVLYNELRRISEAGKPVVTSMGEIAASGGYYVAIAGDHVVAHPTAITGSIGVIIPTFNVSEGLDKIGISGRAVVSGNNKNLADPFEPMEEEHYQILQGMVDEFYQRFQQLVVLRRPNHAPSRLADMTDGRVFTGAEAVQAGLADELGDVRTAFLAAKKLSGVDKAKLVKYGYSERSLTTAYAAVESPVAAGIGNTQASLIQLPENSLTTLQPGTAYYIWLP
jgi:protease IV